MDAVAEVVGHDGYCLFAVDPVSGIRTTMFSRHGLTCSSLRLLRNEVAGDDANPYARLVSTHQVAGVLASDRAGDRSPRLHELMHPDGYRSEVRLVLVDRDGYWGGLSLFRDERHHPFTGQDADDLRQLSAPLAAALRGHHLGPRGPSADPEPAGAVLVDRDGRTRASDEACAWLERLADPGEGGAVADDLMRMVWELAEAAFRAGTPPVARARAASGDWLVGSASRVDADQVAVVLRPGDVGSVVPAFARWAGFTRREASVLLLLAEGRTSRGVARELDISPYTVDDHLRALYRKAGVRGRDELLALVR